MLKIITHFVLSVLVTAFVICIISTQIVLAEVEHFDLEVPLNLRLSVTFQDIFGLTPGLVMLLNS